MAKQSILDGKYFYREQRNLVGQTFGKLNVIESCGKGKGNHYYSKVRCSCGTEYLVPDTELIYGRRTMCKKCIKKTHGMTNTRLFHIWQTMKQRCNCKTNVNYCDYGQRGISVCEEWEQDFMCFYNWSMENGYSDNLTIDRIDFNGNYESSNCRWVDLTAQANNKRNNRMLEFQGIRYTLAEASRAFNINYSALQYRLSHGWDVEKALLTKVRVGRNQHEKAI